MSRSSTYNTINPVRFLYGGKNYFGLYVYQTGPNYTVAKFFGAAFDINVIGGVEVYNNKATILNSEIYNSITTLNDAIKYYLLLIVLKWC